MDYLILYYDLFNNKYVYRVCSCIENAEQFKKDLLRHGIRTIYIYSIYNKFNLIEKEFKKRNEKENR